MAVASRFVFLFCFLVSFFSPPIFHPQLVFLVWAIHWSQGVATVFPLGFLPTAVVATGLRTPLSRRPFCRILHTRALALRQFYGGSILVYSFRPSRSRVVLMWMGVVSRLCVNAWISHAPSMMPFIFYRWPLLFAVCRYRTMNDCVQRWKAHQGGKTWSRIMSHKEPMVEPRTAADLKARARFCV